MVKQKIKKEKLELGRIYKIQFSLSFTQAKINLCLLQYLVNIVYRRAGCGKPACPVQLGVLEYY